MVDIPNYHHHRKKKHKTFRLYGSCGEEFAAYRKAVWDYVLEHSDLQASGVLFIKFHTDSRIEFEKHVRARMHWGYHRGDPNATEAEMLRRQQRAKEVAEKNEREALQRKQLLASFQPKKPWYGDLKEKLGGIVSHFWRRTTKEK